MWTQKPPPSPGRPVARPKTGVTPIQHVRVADDDWGDLKAVAGRGLPDIVRQLIRWYLRRPGAKLPERPSPERIGEVVRKREAEQQ